ncbi:MAG: flavodoxin family protein [Oscillospiraceae bacterium]|nr:flavodoxin family protein [Oscillospiraceae bacterium]
MHATAINGSPRKGWNTDKLLRAALEGAAQNGAETEFIHLYDLDFKGCRSCFECRKIGGSCYGACAIKDGLTPVLEKLLSTDAIFLGSPVYLADVTGGMRCLLERFLYPGLAYVKENKAIYPRRIPLAYIFSMNMGEEEIATRGSFSKELHFLTEMVIGPVEIMWVPDTCQFTDYGKYVSEMFDAEKKKKRLETVFPEECKRARDLGRRLTAPDRQKP